MAAPACPALIFLGSKVGTDLIGTVEFGKAQAGRVLTLPDIHLTFIDDTAIDASLSEPPWLTSVVLSTIQKIDPGDSVLKSYLQGVFTIPIADINLNSTYHLQTNHRPIRPWSNSIHPSSYLNIPYPSASTYGPCHLKTSQAKWLVK